MSQDSSEQAPTSDVIAQMRKKYDADPLSVPTDWQDYFKAVESMEELKATSTPAQREGAGPACRASSRRDTF